MRQRLRRQQLRNKTVPLLICGVGLVFGASGCMETQMAQTLSGVPQVSGVSTGHDKSIASLWSGVSSTESLDLRSYRAGTSQTMKFEFDNGMTCECLAQSTGVGDLMVLSQCKVGSGSTGDPGCSTFADTYNLSTTVDANSNANLKVCDSKTSCELFR